MGLYGDQLNERKERDLLSVNKGERILANSVSSRKVSWDEPRHAMENDLRQIELIAEHFQVEIPFYEPGGEALPELIDLILQPAGIMKRAVRLDGPSGQ